MNTEMIRQGLLKRAKEMREMNPDKWVPQNPRNLSPGKECAVMRNVDWFDYRRVLSFEGQHAVDAFLEKHRSEFGAGTLTSYNDCRARSPIDVAILLEKTAANL